MSKTTNNYTGLEVAVIGMAGRFPEAKNTNELWENIKNGVESVKFFTEEELLNEGEEADLINRPNYIPAGAYMEGKEYFDSEFFKYIPDEAALMDPQARLFHECVWEALEDAGCDLKDKSKKIGLFAGSSNNLNWEVYAKFMNQTGAVDDFSAYQLSNPRFLATRIAHCLNLSGPAVYIDTACSTSLVAIHEACRSLLLGDCNVALAGGVSVNNKSKAGYLHQEGMIYSNDGHCRPFDADASGTMDGEGAGVVVLKSLKNALKDNDNILAIIKGSAINNDGNRKVGFTAPSIDGQMEAIMRAQKWAKIEPNTVQLIEAHGTATPLGDPIEVEALRKVFGPSTDKYCALGSVKSNFGHLDTAAGVTGVIKTVLALKHKILPPSLNFKANNPKIDFTKSPFYVNTEAKEWPKSTTPRRAGVSSFGIGGTNAHIVLEEAPQRTLQANSQEDRLIVLSAKSEKALLNNGTRLANYFENNQFINLSDVAYTLQQGRTALPYRLAITAKNALEAKEKLNSLSVRNISRAEELKSKVVFMFSGQGSQYAQMTKGLYQTVPFFKNQIDQCLNLLKEEADIDLEKILFEENNLINETKYTQPALFVIEYSLAKLMIHWGIQPDLMIGHSIGEYAAACISNVLSLKDALLLVVERGALMQSAPKGDMLSVSLSESELTSLLYNYPKISIAAINSTEMCVVAGAIDQIDDFYLFLSEKGVNCKKIHTSHAFHSDMMDRILDPFAKVVRGKSINQPKIPYLSNVSGELVDYTNLQDPTYWTKQLRGTVQFDKGIENILSNGKNTVFIEVGPGNVLSTFVKNNKRKTEETKVVNLVRHPKEESNDYEYLLSSVGKLWEGGIQPHWKALVEGETRFKVSLPTYAFEKKKYPVNVDAFKLISGLIAKGNVQEELAKVAWKNESAEEENLFIDTSLSSEEQTLLILWNKFFGKDNIHKDDNFFDIGGDSLKAMTVIGRINDQFGVNITLSEFFKRPTISMLAEIIERAPVVRNHTDQPVIKRSVNKEWYPLSSTQKRFYFLHQFDKESLAYNLPQLYAIEGNVDRQKLRKAVDQLIDRYEILRTSFVTKNKKPVQIVADTVHVKIEEKTIEYLDIDKVAKDFIRPFDLAKAPLLRVGLYHIDQTQQILMIDVHHIVADGISLDILMNEFAHYYTGQALPPVALQYRDYVEWQSEEEYSKQYTESKKFWLSTFDSIPSPINLPTDKPRPLVKSSQGNTVAFKITAEQLGQLRAFTEKQSVTTYAFLLTLFSTMLKKLTGENDIVIGTPSAGRPVKAVEKMVGVFVNTLPIRVTMTEDMEFAELLQSVQHNSVSCFEQQYYPYEELIDDLGLKRDTSHNPLFDVLFSYRTAVPSEESEGELKISRLKKELGVTQFDMTLLAIDAGNDIEFSIEYSTDLFEKATVERFAAYFQQLLTSAVSNANLKVKALNMIPEQEKALLVDSFNSTKVAYEVESTIHQIFEERVNDIPEHEAVVFEGTSLTYRELNERSNRLAREILSYDLKEETVVGILLPRSQELLVSIMAVLKSGCTYIPLDPEYPLDRIKYIIEDSGLDIILTDTSMYEMVKSYNTTLKTIDVFSTTLLRHDTSNIDLATKSSQLAYMIYTSGSTGNPKGVMITHSNVLNFVKGIEERIPLNNCSSVLCLTTVSFDIFVLETLVPLLTGRRIVLANENDQKEAEALLNLIEKYKVDAVQMTPSHLKLVLSSTSNEEILNGVKVLMLGGEALPIELLHDLQSAYLGRIFNMYGPTETTVWSTISELTYCSKVDIGKPIANTVIRILDEEGQLQGIGMTGEICIGGDGVGQGYRRKPELTAEKFITDPVSGEIEIYKTGDIGRWLPDGRLECLGRKDSQVKVQGYRIELGEIESQMKNHAEVVDAVVDVKYIGEEPYLIGYYQSSEPIEMATFKGYLSSFLPDYMVPAYFMKMEAFPLTPNGKTDRKSLPVPEFEVGADYVAPSNEIEEKLVGIWSDILQVDPEIISVNTSFFDLGGNSLKANAVVIEIHKVLDADIAVKEMFFKQTIEQLSDYIITINQLNTNTIISDELNEISI